MFDNDSYDPQVIYREVQSFRHPMMIALVAAIDLVIIICIVTDFFLIEKMGSEASKDTNLDKGMLIFSIAMIVFIVVFNLFMLSMKLVTEIRVNNLVIHLRPGFKRIIDYKDIASIEIVQTGGKLRTGGWGYHLSPGWRYYRAPGAHINSIQITLNSNLRILLSSKEPEMTAKQIRDMIRSYGNRI
jgi:hypothetical protein